MKNLQKYFVVSVWLLGLMTLSGCGQPGGGVNAAVHVEPKASNLDIFKETPVVATNEGGSSSAASKGKPGTYSGRIVVIGIPKKRGPVVPQGKRVIDANVCSKTAIPDERLLVDNEGGLANAFIYLKDPPKKSIFDKTPPATTVPFVNVNCQFKPHALFVRTGQKVHVTNKDAVKHNTETAPSVNSAFNQLLDKNDTVGLSLTYKLPEPKPVMVKCSIHSWMVAYHLPLNHPYVAITDEHGNFEIKNLPPGNHTFKVWHESSQGNSGFIKSRHKVKIDGDKKETIEVGVEEMSGTGNIATKVIYLSQIP